MKRDKKNLYWALTVLLFVVLMAAVLKVFLPEKFPGFSGNKKVNESAINLKTDVPDNVDFVKALDDKLDKCVKKMAENNKSATFTEDLGRIGCMRDYLTAEDPEIKADICGQEKYLSAGDFYGRAFCYASLSKNTNSSWENNCNVYAEDMAKKGMDGGKEASFDRCVFAYLSYQPNSLNEGLCGKMKTKRGQDNCSAILKRFNELKDRDVAKMASESIVNCLGKGTLTSKDLCAQEVIAKYDNPFICLAGEKVLGIKSGRCFGLRNIARGDIACLSRNLEALVNCGGK